MHLYNAWLPPPVAEESIKERDSFSRVVSSVKNSYRSDDPDSVYATLKWVSVIDLFIKAKSEVSMEDVSGLIEFGLELFHVSENKLYAQVRWGNILVKLLNKYRKKLLLKVKWRPLYDTLIHTHFSRNTGPEGWRLRQRHFEATTSLVRSCRKFFPPGSAVEIWSEFRSLLENPWHNSSFEGSGFVRLFLPTNLDNQDFFTHDWIKELMDLWDSIPNCQFWNSQWTAIIARVVKNYRFIDWESYLPTLFTRFLNMFEVPVANGSGSYPFSVDVPRNTRFLFSNRTVTPAKGIAKSIVYLLKPGSSVLEHFEKLVNLLEQYYHPSNGGRWTYSLERFLLHLVISFQKRLQNEQLKVNKDREDEQYLGKSERHFFVKVVLKLIDRGQYSKNEHLSETVAAATSILSYVEPSLILPFVASRFHMALETMTATHQLQVAVMSVAFVGRSLFLESLSTSTVKSIDIGSGEAGDEFVELLMVSLSNALLGMDANDPPKTLATMQLIGSIFSNMSSLDDEVSVMPMIRFSEWLDEFFCRLFALLLHLEPSSVTNEGLHSSATSGTFLVEDGPYYYCMLEILFGRLSKPLYNQALKKISKFVKTNILPGAIAEVGLLCCACVYSNPEEAVTQLVEPILLSVISSLEGTPSTGFGGRGICDASVSTKAKPTISPALETAIDYQLKILSVAISYGGPALLRYKDQFKEAVVSAFESPSWKVNGAGDHLLRSLLGSLVLYYPIDQYKCILHHPNATALEEWISSKDYSDDKPLVGPKWHIPSVEEVKFANELLNSEFAVPYEELFAEPKKRTKLHKESRRQPERVSPPKEAKRSCSEENIDLPNEAAYESFDGVKKFSMSYNQSNNRSKSFAGVHSVPAYTCLVDETAPLRATEGDKSVSMSMSSVAKERTMEGNRSVKAMRDQPAGDTGKQASGGGGVKAQNNSNWKNSIDELFNSNETGQETPPSSSPPFSSQVSEGDKPVSLVANGASSVNGVERKMEGNHHMKAAGDHQATDASKQTSGGVAKVQNNSKWRSSGSIDKLFYSGEIAQETRPSNMPPVSSMRSDGKGEFEKPMASMFGVFNRDTFEGADSVSSPPYFDEEVDTNSVAAASVAALTKAIEEAQASIQMAKELMDRKKFGPQNRVKLSFDNSMKPKSRKGGRFADKATISKETKTQELYDTVDVPVHVSAEPEQVTPVFENASIISDVMVTGEEVHEKEIADNASIFTKKKTQELQEEVHVSAGPEQVSVALEDTDKLSGVMETREKVHGQEFKPTPTDHRHEEADDSEAAEQFYEFADTIEQDVSEATEQFYEVADSSEPDVSEATEEFYEFADSNGRHDTVLENQEANNTRKMFRSVDNDEQEKKTDMEAFENPEQVGMTLKAATEEEQREVENIFNIVGGVSEFDENENGLASSQEGSNQEDNEKPREAPREHEETAKLTTTHVKETCEEKQNGDDKRFETQKLQETEHVDIKLVAQERVENEKIDREACMLEENETEQTYAQSEEDTDRSLNEDNKEEIIETVNDLYDKEDFEKRLKDDSKSEGNEKLQDTRPNEKILEEATCHKECENRQEESFEFVGVGRMQILMDESTENEKVQVTEEDQKSLECNFEAADNLYEQGVSGDLNSKQGSARHVDCNQVPMDESTENEKLQVTREDQKNLECNSEAADNLYEQGVSRDLNSKQGSARHVDCDQDVEETQKLPTNKEDGGVREGAETSIQLEENEHQTELVEEENGMAEKEICETDGLTKLPERPKKMEDATEIHSFDKNGIRASESDMSFVQKQDDKLAVESNVDYSVGRQVEECEELGDINSDMMGAEVAVNQERNKNGPKSRKRWFGTNEVSETFIKLEEDGNQSELVEEEDVMEEKVICEIEGLASGVKLAEILKQMEDAIEIHSSDKNGTSVYGQKQDAQLAREPEVACNVGMHVEELGDINKNMMGPEVAAVNQEENVNITKSSHRKRWFDNGKDTKVAQAPHIFGRKAGSVLLDNETDTSLYTKIDKENHHKVMTSQSTEVNEDSQQATLRLKESDTIHSSLKESEQENNENPQTTLSAEESETDHNSQEVEQEGQATLTAKEIETNYTSQKEVEREKENQQESQTANEFEISASSQKVVELEKEHLIQKAEKRRERERQKEKRAVERAIREARERSFADVKERVAETRQKVMAEAQGRLGKTSVQAKDTSLAEQASKEAKQKWERAAVERATAEARDRFLEKALSAKKSVPEKYSGASTEGKQAKRSASEKFSGASRDNGANRSFDLESKGSLSSSASRSPNSSHQSDPSPGERSAGTNGESAQRSKATLERNQRTAERAAKALAEKNNRDLLVQQEQAERNRLAEVLDAEVKRWSSGKERNLRALLSTLQYILGPDSGWQPVPLTDIVTAVAVKKAYRKAALFVHPDKLQQRGASIQQKYTCEKVFDLLKDAWNRFSTEER